MKPDGEESSLMECMVREKSEATLKSGGEAKQR